VRDRNLELTEPADKPSAADLALHEIRRPLALIVTAARALQERDATNADAALLVRVAERLLRTTESVCGHTPRDEAPADPGAVVSAVAADFAELGADLRVWAEPGGPTKVADPRALEAAVQALVGNALDHGEPAAPVDIRVTGADEVVVIDIVNALARRPRPGGRGWGTDLVSALSQRLGGTIEYTSADGVFRARLVVPVQAPASRARSVAST
jgi:nitrogen-specific signal transduction histidine kinase